MIKINQVIKIISLTLIFTLLLQIFPLQAIANHASTADLPKEEIAKEFYLDDDGNIVYESEATEDGVAAILYEDVSQREANKKVFVLRDGSTMAAEYPHTVHYEKDGSWEDIDNTLVEDKALTANDINGFKNRNNQVQIKFAKSTNEKNILDVKYEDVSLSWSLKGSDRNNSTAHIPEKAKVAVTNDITKPEEYNEKFLNRTDISSEVYYTNIYPNVDLQYILSGSSVKENIILNAESEKYEFAFELSLKKLKPMLKEDGSIYIYRIDDDEEPVFIIPAPFMYDANHNYSDSVKYEIESVDQKGTYNLKIIADEEWINSKDIKFPVTIDPVLITDPDISTIDNKIVSEKNQPGTMGEFFALYFFYNLFSEILFGKHTQLGIKNNKKLS